MTKTRTAAQQAVVDRLVQNFNIAGDKVQFLNDADPLEPWLNSKALIAIARQSGEFQQIAESFSEFIPGLDQIVHTATIVDPKGRGYTRSGVAKLGERLPNEEVADEHDLAAARALRSALDDAGFDVTKVAPVLDLKLPPGEHAEAHERATRLNDLKRIHMIAAEKGLILPFEDDPAKNDASPYREWLAKHFQVNTTAAMGPADRARVINALMEYEAPKAQAA